MVRDTVLLLTGEGVIKEWNARAERLFGFTREQALDSHIEMLRPESGQDWVFDTVLDKRSPEWRGDVHMKASDGQIKRCRVRMRLVEWEDQDRWLVTIRSVTPTARLKLLAEETADLQFWIEPGGYASYISPTCEKIMGYAVHELIDRPLRHLSREMIHPEDRQKLSDFVIRGLRGEPGEGEEFRIIKKDGQVIWVALSWRPVYNEGDQFLGLRGSLRDITRRKETEIELARQRNLYHTLISHIPDMVYFKDADGVYLSVNEAFLNYFGALEEEVIGHTDKRAHDPDIDSLYREENAEIMRERQTLNAERRLGRRKIWHSITKTPVINDQDEVIGIVGIARNIDGLKKQQQALRESEERFRRTFESVQDTIWSVTLDGRTPISSLISPACFQLTGYTPEELIADSSIWHDLIWDEDLHLVEDAWEENMKGQPARIEYRIVDKAGSLHWVRHHAVPIRNAEGRIIRVDSVLSDITDARQLNEVKRMMTKQTIHSIKTPLTVAMNYRKLLMDDADSLSELQRQSLLAIGSSLDQIHVLINKLLNIELMLRLQDMPVEVVAWDDLVRRVIKTHHYWILGRKHSVQCELEGDPSVLGDSFQLEQVLSNLISNAIKYTPSGGQIMLRSYVTSGELHVEVEDNGVGIPQEKQKGLFREFYKADLPDDPKEDIKSTGLGLSMVKTVVEHYGGGVWAQSEPAKGSIFGFWLPLYRQSPHSSP
jgi:hypothetical protein